MGIRANLVEEGGRSKRVGYNARIKKCASRKCWGLYSSVSADEALPDPNEHVFPLFEGTKLTGPEKAGLRQEGIWFDEEAARLKDPGDRLPFRVEIAPKVFRHSGLPPADGSDRDKKPCGEKRAKQQEEKREQRALLHRGDGLVKGKPVRNRNELSKAMRENCVMGMLLKGTVVSSSTDVDGAGDAERRFVIKVEGLAGADTGKTYVVVIKRVCECTCAGYRRMMENRRTGFTWCKHIYAVLIKVLGIHMSDPLLKAVAFNKAEWMQIMSKVANVKGLGVAVGS